MVKKSTFSLPDDVHKNLTEMAKFLGISRSALLSELLGEALQRMLLVTQVLPENIPPEVYRRFRGESQRVIRQQIKELQDYADEVFDDD